MAYKTEKLKARIIERCGSYKAFADMLGMDKTTLSHALSKGSEWRGSRLIQAVEVLEIPTEEIREYFFEPTEKGNRKKRK
jgi:hypothetical protein